MIDNYCVIKEYSGKKKDDNKIIGSEDLEITIDDHLEENVL